MQRELNLQTWGGRRRRAGRPRTIGWVPRVRRPDFPKRFPIYITLRIRPEVGNLRRGDIFEAIQRSFLKGHNRFGMRLVEFSVQSDRIYLVVEADDRRSLTRGLQGLSVRI